MSGLRVRLVKHIKWVQSRIFAGKLDAFVVSKFRPSRAREHRGRVSQTQRKLEARAIG